MAQFTPEQRAQLADLQAQRKGIMRSLMALPNTDELNKKFLLGQLQDVETEMSSIVHAS